MAKDPAFLFYYQDFLVGTDDMDNETVGAYIRCLCHQAHKGAISEKHMKKICNSSEVHNAIKEKFKTDQTGENFFNERLAQELEKRKAYSESRASNRKGKKKEPDLEGKICKTYVPHMEDEDEDEDENEIEVRKGGVGEKQKQKIDYSLVLEKFNQSCQHLPQVKVMTDSRRKSIKARIEEFDLDTLFAVFELAGESDMLNGENDRGWRASLDWILKPANFAKIMEGNYANRPKKKPPQPESKFERAQRIYQEVMHDYQTSKKA